MLNNGSSTFGKGAAAGAPGATNWILLVRSDGSDANEFIEIRQNACAVWSAHGAPYTLGEKQLRAFPSVQEAEAFLRQAMTDYEAEGFELAHTGRSIPGKLDVDLLEQAVHDGARAAYRRMCAEHMEEVMSGFSLVTDSDGMTISPAAMSQTSFADIEEDEDYYRTNPSEWPYTTDAGLLLAYRIIVVAAFENCDIPFEKDIPDYFEQFSELCIRALQRLDHDGLFGSGDRRENFILLFGVSDSGPTKSALRRLNPKSVYQLHAHCFDE